VLYVDIKSGPAYVCMHVCVYVCMHVMYVCMYVVLCMYVCLCMYIFVMYVCNVCTCVCSTHVDYTCVDSSVSVQI
jgi:hypothetical protein